MKIKLIAVFFISIFIQKNAFSQFQLKVKSLNTIDSIAYLRGVVFDDKNFIPKDTLELYKGINTVNNSKPIVGGIYYLYFPKTKQKLYLAIDNKDSFSISIADSNYMKSVFTKNEKNDFFFSYQKLEQSLSSVDSLFSIQLKQGKKFNLSQKAIFFKEKNLKLTLARNQFLHSSNPSTALAIYFDALNKLDRSIPSKKNFVERNNFLKSIDLNSPKLLFSPCLKEMYAEYLSYFPLQADSIIKGVDSIMLKLDCKGKHILILLII